MDFTREPIIETIITPKEGHKLVIRSSKSAGQEEYFVDAVEVVAFGPALFFRSMERPKSFLVPVFDYEVLEVREARMVLKNVGHDRSIKIGGGKEAGTKQPREEEKSEIFIDEESGIEEKAALPEASAEGRSDVKVDKKRDRRRNYRRKRGREEGADEAAAGESLPASTEEEKVGPMHAEESVEEPLQPTSALTPAQLSSLLQPPPTLISETINRYRQNDLFKGAFYLTDEEQYKPHDKVDDLLNEDDEEGTPRLQEPTFDIQPEEEASEVSTSSSDKGNDEAVEGLALYAQEGDSSMEGVVFHLPPEKADHLPPPPPPKHHEESDLEKS